MVFSKLEVWCQSWKPHNHNWFRFADSFNCMLFGAVGLVMYVKSTLGICFSLWYFCKTSPDTAVRKQGLYSKLFYVFSFLSEQWWIWDKHNKMQRCEVSFILAELRNTRLFFPSLKVTVLPLLVAYFMLCSLYKQHSESKMSTSKHRLVVCKPS